MKGNPIQYDNFIVYPEYPDIRAADLMTPLDETEDKIIVAAVPTSIEGGYQVVGAAYNKGRLIWSRPKYEITSAEKEGGCIAGKIPPKVVGLGGKNVLILICYELLFPHDYLMQAYINKMGHPDLVIHMVGFPMYDENQREGWVAMQDALTLTYDCPLVCCCGGTKIGDRMNISRIINA